MLFWMKANLFIELKAQRGPQLSSLRTQGFQPYFSRSAKATPFDQPKPAWTGYSPSPPGDPGALASYFSNCTQAFQPAQPQTLLEVNNIKLHQASPLSHEHQSGAAFLFRR